MIDRSRFLVIFLIMLCIGSSAQAGEPTLTIHQFPNTEYEAVIKNDTDVFCFVKVNPSSSVIVTGTKVLIESPANEFPVVCIEPVPPTKYFEESAHIGVLTPGVYTVSWVQPGDFSLSTQLRVSELNPDPIPSSSLWSLILLALVILAVSRPFVRQR